ncbi:hypothetical protein KBC59_02825 [Patescibacteria group bacterium]|nr:hypothetical protein [Patescibacteria group bacterium]
MKSLSSVYALVALGVIAGGIAGYYIGADHSWKRFRRMPNSYPPAGDLVTPPSTPPPEETGSSDCVPAGCSGIICADADSAATIVSTCEYRADYACYTTATCERQATGKCGWTQTTELTTCLKNPPSLE